jgi:alkanesulfonate monooxygenase SsuD/methylene tetrahydromethanopterin reductase-like flavin-dependent oxidoreductase (luciferase family)
MQVSAVIAGAAERLGITRIGIADSPHIYGSLYPTIQHLLSQTAAVQFGPLVTNPVTRHKSVHVATYRAFEELYPGRTFLGIATGDSAVHSVGLQPSGVDAVAELADAVRAGCGAGLPIATAVGGPRAARAVGDSSDAVLFGCGLDAGEITRLESYIHGGCAARRRWVYVPAFLVSDQSAVSAARRAVRAPVVSFSRHALFGGMRRKGVPDDLVAGLEAMYRGYDFSQHSVLGSSNAGLLDDSSNEGRYLFNRFALVDTPQRAAERVIDLATEIGDFDLFLGTLVPDVMSHLQNIAEAFRSRLDELF